MLDGALPAGVNALENLAPGTARALQRLIDDCHADAACREAFPRLDSLLEAAVARLNAQPAEIAGLSAVGTLRLNGADLIRLLHDLLADATYVYALPAFITALAEESYDDTAMLAPLAFNTELDSVDGHSEGLYMSVICADIAARASAAKIVASADNLPAIYAPLAESAIELLGFCRAWTGTDEMNSLSQPARLDAPVLLLSGRYDPNASSSGFGDLSRKTWRVELARLGHSILPGSACAVLVMEQFLSNPQVDPSHSCLQQSQEGSFRLRNSD